MSSRLPSLWSRLIAEFLVIVVGVLVALGLDQWVASRKDRDLETEYLERLLDDVRYDLSELSFIQERSRISLAADRLITEPAWVREAPGDSLLATAIVAALSRSPDLSRSTFTELVNSGRIELLRSREVREALSVYDRSVIEMLSFFSLWRAGAQEWLYSRIPADKRERYERVCATRAEEGRFLAGVCDFEFDMDPEPIRADLLTREAQERFTLLGHRYTTGITVSGVMISAAQTLEAVLESALAEQ